MPTAANPAKASGNRELSGIPWREILFWVFLLSPFAALNSANPRREIAGLIEACVFLVVALTSIGRLKTLGMEFVAWERISGRVLAFCVLCGFAAGGAIIVVAKVFHQSLGIEPGWNKIVLIVVLGPILEEVFFRGYLMALALYLTKHLARSVSSVVCVLSIAILFSLGHLVKPGTTGIQLLCITATGSLYGWLRLRFHSTVAAAVATHATYNFALYLSYWLGL